MFICNFHKPLCLCGFKEKERKRKREREREREGGREGEKESSHLHKGIMNITSHDCGEVGVLMLSLQFPQALVFELVLQFAFHVKPLIKETISGC